MPNSSKFNDSFFVLLEAYCNGYRIPINDLCEKLYDCDYIFEKDFGTFLSQRAKAKHQQAFVGNGKTKPDGLWNEHILTRKERVLKMIDMVIHRGAGRTELEKYMYDSWCCVYKLRDEKEEGIEAMSLLPEEHRLEIDLNEYIVKR